METGHAKNVANFEQVVIILTGLGAVYNPSQALILLPALQAKLTEAQAALAAEDTAEADRTVKIDEVQDEFKGLVEYAVNIKRTADVDVNEAAFTNDLSSVVNKMRSQGRDTGLTDDPATPEDESRTGRSTAQLSRDSLVSHFTDLIALIKTKEDKYTTTDAEYTIAAMEAKLQALKTKNNAAKTSIAVLGNAKDERDHILYDEETGILKLVKLIKTQLTKKPGKNSSAYQQINALEFRKVKP